MASSNSSVSTGFLRLASARRAAATSMAVWATAVSLGLAPVVSDISVSSVRQHRRDSDPTCDAAIDP